MDFGMALIALKRGETVARSGWNNKGLFLTLQNGSAVDGNDMRNEGAKKYYADTKCTIAPHIDMKTADGTYNVGWLASQADMLAEDWEIACCDGEQDKPNVFQQFLEKELPEDIQRRVERAAEYGESNAEYFFRAGFFLAHELEEAKKNQDGGKR